MHKTLSFDHVPTAITAKKLLVAVTAKAGLPVGTSSNLIYRSKLIGDRTSLQSAGVLTGETLVLSCGPMLGGSQINFELEDSFSSAHRKKLVKVLELSNSSTRRNLLDDKNPSDHTLQKLDDEGI